MSWTGTPSAAEGGVCEHHLSLCPDGCHIDLMVGRKPVSTKARLLDLAFRGYGRWFHGRDLRRTLRMLEGDGP